MRRFLLLHVMFGGSPPAPSTLAYVNRDLITVVVPAGVSAGNEYAGARSHLSFNSSTYRDVKETPDEVMKTPCVNARGDPEWTAARAPGAPCLGHFIR